MVQADSGYYMAQLSHNITDGAKEPQTNVKNESYGLVTHLENYKYVKHVYIDTEGIRIILDGGNYYDHDAIIGLMHREFNCEFGEQHLPRDGSNGMVQWFDRQGNTE